MNKLSLSLVAIAMLSTAAVADISSKNFGGTASLFYDTTDANDGDFFDKSASMGNVAVQLGGAASVGSCETCTTLNYGVTGVSTVGLENTLVSGTWVDHSLDDSVWIDTLNLAFHPLDGISNTTMVLGRQELDTPMVFTEKWNIARNTYDAAVVLNQDIQDVTLVGAWVGRSNVAGGMTVKNPAGYNSNGFNKFLTDEGAYAAGLVTTLIPTVTAQAWYYVAPSAADIAWLQADSSFMGFGVGGQYFYSDTKSTDKQEGGFAVKLGYDYEGIGLSAAYSSMDKDAHSAANLGGAQSKLYTEGWWTYGEVSQADTDAFNVTATYSLPGIADLGVYYTNADHGADANKDFQEIAVTAGHDFDNLNITAAFINGDYDGDVDDAGKDIDSTNNIQVYATYKF
jgi:hypothetical protein